MTQVANARQISSAFWKFFLFFILAVIAIVGAAFFNYQMPRTENTILKAKLENYEATGSASQNFKETLTSVKKMIDELDKQGNSMETYDQQITVKLAELKKMAGSDHLNMTIADGLDQYRFYKKKSISVDKGAEELQKKEAELQKCADELKKFDEKTRKLEADIAKLEQDKRNCGCTN